MLLLPNPDLKVLRSNSLAVWPISSDAFNTVFYNLTCKNTEHYSGFTVKMIVVIQQPTVGVNTVLVELVMNVLD